MGFMPLAFNASVEKPINTPKFGTVVYNNDPLKIGRVKATIPGIFTGSISSLPWIRRKTDTLFCGDDCEVFDVPEIGSIIEVRWPYDDVTPIYSGAPYSKRHQSGAFTDNYPYEAGFRFGPHVIKFDKASNLMIIENGKLQIVLDSFGDCNMVVNNLTVNCKKMFVEGDLHVSGHVEAASLDSDNGATGVISLANIATVANGVVQSVE